VCVALFASEGDGTKSTVGRGSDGIAAAARLDCSEHWNNGPEMTGALPRTSLPDQVFHRLVSDVLAGRHAPGERLPTQRALAAELGVNMASVREGVKRLEQLGLVEVRHGDAMRVLDWRLHGGPDVLVHLIAHAGGLDAEIARSVMEARRLLLAESARLAAERRSDEQAALLVSLAGQLAAATDDEAAQHLDFAFFAVLIQAAGNVVFLLVMNSIRALYLDNLELFRPMLSTADGYGAAARAVAEGDADAAAAATAALAAAQEARLLP
jgi:GntR family transcriptional repressor for pyruvate dehydrogenase complex